MLYHENCSWRETGGNPKWKHDLYYMEVYSRSFRIPLAIIIFSQQYMPLNFFFLYLPSNRTISFDFDNSIPFHDHTDYTESFSLSYVDVNKGKRNWEIEIEKLAIAALPKTHVTYEVGGRRIFSCNQLQYIIVRMYYLNANDIFFQSQPYNLWTWKTSWINC